MGIMSAEGARFGADGCGWWRIFFFFFSGVGGDCVEGVDGFPGELFGSEFGRVDRLDFAFRVENRIWPGI